jgi:hypothetical protein
MAARKPVKGVFGAMMRLVMPVLCLIGAYGFAYMTRTLPIHLFDNQAVLGQAGLEPSRWLTFSHLAVLIAFFTVMIVNRMYGPAYALVQIVLSWIIVAGVVLFAWPDISRLLPQLGTVPDWRAG